jgi:hypothetical protein
MHLVGYLHCSLPMQSTYKTYKNELLSVLPPQVLLRWATQIELVHLPLGTVLYESGAKLNYVYFPEDCIVSLLFVLENGSTTEIAVVGHEGLVGISIFMRGEPRLIEQSFKVQAGRFAFHRALLKPSFTGRLKSCTCYFVSQKP